MVISPRVPKVHSNPNVVPVSWNSCLIQTHLYYSLSPKTCCVIWLPRSTCLEHISSGKQNSTTACSPPLRWKSTVWPHQYCQTLIISKTGWKHPNCQLGIAHVLCRLLRCWPGRAGCPREHVKDLTPQTVLLVPHMRQHQQELVS